MLWHGLEHINFLYIFRKTFFSLLVVVVVIKETASPKITLLQLGIFIALNIASNRVNQFGKYSRGNEKCSCKTCTYTHCLVRLIRNIYLWIDFWFNSICSSRATKKILLHCVQSEKGRKSCTRELFSMKTVHCRKKYESFSLFDRSERSKFTQDDKIVLKWVKSWKEVLKVKQETVGALI